MSVFTSDTSGEQQAFSKEQSNHGVIAVPIQYLFGLFGLLRSRPSRAGGAMTDCKVTVLSIVIIALTRSPQVIFF